MPTGRVKWFSLEKGFGFISSDEGEDVYLAASALPAGVTTVKPGTKLEFGVAEGRKGPQALSVRIIDAPPSLANSKAGAEDLAVLIEESIKMLDMEKLKLLLELPLRRYKTVNRLPSWYRLLC